MILHKMFKLLKPEFENNLELFKNLEKTIKDDYGLKIDE